MCFVNKKSLRVFGIVALSIILSACGGGTSNDTSGQDIPVVIQGPGPGPAPGPGPGPGPAPGPGPTPKPAPPAELASRVQGVAPLAVFFDAINVPGVAQPPEVNGRREYADFDYTWNFNDPSSGIWATSGRSKNEASGYNAAHVFETPGTYTVTLSVKNGISVNETHQVTITVEDPDTIYAGGATICVSSTSVFTGCPAGAIQHTTTDVTSIGAFLAPDRRILFRRGDTWSTNGVIQLSNANLTIGAYGNCTSPDARGICSNAPLFNVSANAGKGLFHAHNQNDARIMDLHIVDADSRETAVGGETGLNNLLLLRLKSEGFRVPFNFTHWNTGGHDQIALVENDSSRSRINITYIGSERLMILGNRLRDPDESHVVRVYQVYKGVIAHNELSGSSAKSTAGRQALKLHGPSQTKLQGGIGGLNQPTKYVVVADNLIGSSGIWPMSIGPKNNETDERLNDIVVENNRFYSGFGTQSSPVQNSLLIWSSYTTVRNNVFSGDGSFKKYIGISVRRSLTAPAPTGNRIFNNTIYKNTVPVDGDTSMGILVQSADCINTEVKNNLVHFHTDLSDLVAKAAVVDNGTNTTQSNNLLTDASLLVDPENPDFMAKDFSLDVNSPAINAGTNVPVLKDIVGGERTLGGTTDLGAYERQ